MSGHDCSVDAQSRADDTCPPDPHEGVDPHIWLSPELVKQQAQTICAALQRIDPLHTQMYSANCASFLKEIDCVQDSIHAIVKPGRMFMVFHPSWAYFSREFGLKQIAIEIDGKEPSPRELAFILEEAQKYHLSTIFVQPQFSQQSAHVIARQLNGRVVMADDLAYDWAANLIAVAKAIAEQ
jgi:zinc transport system substrate-binding protein